MEQKLIFIGYHDFNSKDGTKHFYVLDFISEPKIDQRKVSAISNHVTIFTDQDKYNTFIKENKLLSLSSVKFELNGDKVRYFI